MLEPKKVKYRRVHRGNRRGMAMRGNHVAFGTYGLKAIEPGWITARQIEASRIVISRVVRKRNHCSDTCRSIVRDLFQKMWMGLKIGAENVDCVQNRCRVLTDVLKLL